MDYSSFEIGLALLLLIVAGSLVAWYLRYKASRSETRMLRMLQRLGVDMEVTTQNDRAAVMREIRRRCRRCQTEAVCERWLAGKHEGGNTFCPNRRVIAELAREVRAA